MEELAKKSCVPCKKGVLPLKGAAIRELLKGLDEGWQVVEDHHLEKEYTFLNFQEALNFANHIGELAEAECHHPDIYLSYGKLKIQLWTHKIDGLSENDFILASKCDLLKKKKAA